jgi:hypothetical protein
MSGDQLAEIVSDADESLQLIVFKRGDFGTGMADEFVA